MVIERLNHTRVVGDQPGKGLTATLPCNA